MLVSDASPSSSSHPRLLYAELLLNIRSLAVFAALESEPKNDTVADLSNDWCSFTLRHAGVEVTIPLPLSVVPRSSVNLPLPTCRSNELNFRLPIASAAPLLKLQNDTENVVPWSARKLASSSAVCCRTCSTPFVKSHSIQRWNDLPSESWAEMMDFWHCHKPHNHAQTDDTSKKGYAAASRFQVHAGRGDIGVSYLVFHKQDCCSINFNALASSNVDSSTLSCKTCAAVVGLCDTVDNGLRLHKWALLVDYTDTSLVSKYPVEKWITAEILSMTETSATRTFRLPSPNEALPTLLLWIFTPDLWYSSSHQPLNPVTSTHPSKPNIPCRALKVLWKPSERLPIKGTRPGVAAEELNLPAQLLEILHIALAENQELLPRSGREYRGWHVSLLHRFTQEDVM